MIYLIEVRQNRDLLTKLLKSGYLATKFYQHIEIVKRHDSYIQQGVDRYQSVINCTVDFRCSTGTIYNALKRIKISEINDTV